MSLESSPGYQQSKRLTRFHQVASAIFITAATIITIACAGGSPTSSQTPFGSELSLSPSAVTLSSGAVQQFSAALKSAASTAILWKASAGSISSNGLYTAPSVTSPTIVLVTATSLADGSNTASSQITVTPLLKMAVTATALPGATQGTVYSTDLQAHGGNAPFQWGVTAGTLPAGLVLGKSNGAISGIPTKSGNSNFSITVTDANSRSASGSYSIAVAARPSTSSSSSSSSSSGSTSSTSTGYDGPAELPQLYVQSDMVDTPAPGSVINVPAGGNLQNAINNAQCGQTIALQAGAVYTGFFTFPDKACDDSHWIVVRTSALSSLPAEGTRATPCYAGVSSLPGRPTLNCKSTANVMARLQFSSTGSGPIVLKNGANHYRFVGLEITRTPSTGVVYNLAFNQNGATSDHIIFDRSWFHGTAQDETQRGVMLDGTHYAAVIDSYFSDFHCVAVTGSCLDAQTVAGGLGSIASGTWKIVDNFLEASGESILFGGGTATVTPTDIEIRRNHMFKPMTWMKGQPGYVGGRSGHPFIVKNGFELKNAQRVLFEGNIVENAWGGFSQFGFGIVITPKNQAIGTRNVCPACQVTDVTIRYSTVSHVGDGLQIANALSDNGGAPLAGERYSIHDLIIDDIDPVKFDGYGTFAQVSTGDGAPLLSYVTINHITAFEPKVMLNLADFTTTNPKMPGFEFTNNIVNGGSAPIQTTGGGTANCAYVPGPLTALDACFEPYTFSHNAIIATPLTLFFTPSKYPSGNYFPTTTTAVQFVNYSGGNGGNYQLQSTSPYKNAGTDGKDLGADIATIQSTIAGVE